MEEVNYLESDQQGDRVHTVVSSINIISHEEIIGVGTLPSDPEQLHQVMKLTMNIATDRHRTFHLGTIQSQNKQPVFYPEIAFSPLARCSLWREFPWLFHRGT